MSELQLNGQAICFDREATAAVYDHLPTGDANRCGCLCCQNYARQRPHAFPAFFLSLLDQLGIKPERESEVWELGPAENGCRLYGGCFAFTGELIRDERPAHGPEQAVPAFRCWFTTSFPAAPPELPKPLLAVEFVTQLPWLLSEDPE